MHLSPNLVEAEKAAGDLGLVLRRACPGILMAEVWLLVPKWMLAGTFLKSKLPTLCFLIVRQTVGWTCEDPTLGQHLPSLSFCRSRREDLGRLRMW